MTDLRRMPDGSTTRDVDEYLNAWGNIAKSIEELLPGYQVYGYDPGFALRPTEQNRYDSFYLPMAAVMILISTRKS